MNQIALAVCSLQRPLFLSKLAMSFNSSCGGGRSNSYFAHHASSSTTLPTAATRFRFHDDLQETHTFLFSHPGVCPEPVLANESFS
jgi:hypothetical protein